jgi:hypothetical protein
MARCASEICARWLPDVMVTCGAGIHVEWTGVVLGGGGRADDLGAAARCGAASLRDVAARVAAAAHSGRRIAVTEAQWDPYT